MCICECGKIYVYAQGVLFANNSNFCFNYK